MYRKRCCFLAAVIILLHCNTVSAQFIQQDFNKFFALTGTWQKQEGNGMLYEVWQKTNDTTLNGHSFSVNGKDTTAEESVVLALRHGMISYTPTISGQNGGLPVTFNLNRVTSEGFTFENPAHDFPQNIHYQPKGDSLIAGISGKTDKGFREVSYHYSRAGTSYDINPMSYFVGIWRFKAWTPAHAGNAQPDISATWVVEMGLSKAFCLSGHVVMDDGKTFTGEIIGYNPAQKLFTRTVAANDSSFFSFTSKGWQGDKLSWTGTRSDVNGTTAMKQEIAKKGTDSFSAVFYVQKNNQWVEVMKEQLDRSNSK